MSPVALARRIAQYRCKCCCCGSCCIYCSPILLEDEDIKRLENKGYIREDFVKVVDGENFIKEDLPCMFLWTDTLKCGIYEDRPRVCRLHPFMSNKELDVDAWWIDSRCGAMSDFWNDEMNGNPVFKRIMELTDNEVFLRNATNTMKRLIKNKFNI